MRYVLATAGLRYMIDDMNRQVKGRDTGNATLKATWSVANASTPPTGFGPVKDELGPKRTRPAERAARGQKSRNRRANPLTCRASDLLCLDANAAQCPLFRRIFGQSAKNTKASGGRAGFRGPRPRSILIPGPPCATPRPAGAAHKKRPSSRKVRFRALCGRTIT